jgi:hypothetical protein
MALSPENAMKNSTKKSGYDRFMALSDAAKEKEWESLNDPRSTATFGPMDAAARRNWLKAARRNSKGLERRQTIVSIELESELLTRADRYAKRRKTSTAALIKRGLEAVLAGVV